MKTRFDMVSCYVVRHRKSKPGFEFLQLRRAPGKFLGGAWSTVRGKVEPGESGWGAALRELREETGFAPLEFYQVDIVDIFYLHGDDTIWHCPGFCALIDPLADVVLNNEHDAFRWVDREAVDREFLWPGERAQIAELCREILDNGPAKPYLRIELQHAR